MAWIVLLLAGLLEIGWSVTLKYSQGMTRPGPSLLTLALLSLSFFLLSVAMKHLPLGTAYAVWTGTGAVGTALMGILLFNEPASALRLACIACIVLGIVGLSLTSPS